MTTIAYKSGIIAADRRVVLDYLYTSGPTKIAKTTRPWNQDVLKVLCGGSGNGPNMELWKEWVLNGSNMMDRPGSLSDREEFVVGLEIRLYPNELPKIYLHEQMGYREIAGDMWAIGSGKDLAIGAMAMGATAIQAVKIASHFDTWTDHQVDCLGFLEPPTT